MQEISKYIYSPPGPHTYIVLSLKSDESPSFYALPLHLYMLFHLTWITAALLICLRPRTAQKWRQKWNVTMFSTLHQDPLYQIFISGSESETSQSLTHDENQAFTQPLCVNVLMFWCPYVTFWYNCINVTRRCTYCTELPSGEQDFVKQFWKQMLENTPISRDNWPTEKVSGRLFSCQVQSLFPSSKRKCTVIQGGFSIVKFIKKVCETI